MWALGNSLWLPYEHRHKLNQFNLDDFTWHRDDDVAQALMLAETLIQHGWSYKHSTFFKKLQCWFLHWYDSLTDWPEGCWRQTRDVLSTSIFDWDYIPRRIDMDWQHLDWNWSLMRVWPAWMVDYNYWWNQSMVTHNTNICFDACDFFADLLYNIEPGQDKEKAIKKSYKNMLHPDESEEFADFMRFEKYKEPIQHPSWYVLNTLHAVLYTFLHTDSPMEWFKYIINLAGDTDTTACIYWYLAWAYYWIDEECQQLIDKIEDVDYIKYLSRKLIALN